MNAPSRTRVHDAGRDWLQITLSALAVIGIGVVAGLQYVEPDKRILALAAAVAIFGIAWRLNVVSAIGLLLVLLPFPRSTSFGSTNMAFLLLMLVIWLLRFSQRQVPPPRATPIDKPIIALLIAYIISFYNVEKATHVEPALRNTLLFVGCIGMFFLIVQNVRSEADLRRLHLFQAAGVALLYVFCVWELMFPGHVLIPGWIDFSTINVDLIEVKGYRVGGPWLDYELLSEFAAINIVFFTFLIAQARSMSRRVVFVGLLLLSVLILFSTVTRGGIAALGVGLLYLMWLVRRRIQVVPFTILLGISLVVILSLNFYVSNFTTAGDVFSRFGATKFVGVIPDSRSEAWPQAFGRWTQHPFIGIGPLYSAERGLRLWSWPHCLYLYLAVCFGVVGLSAFLWMAWKMWSASRPETDRLDDPNYTKAFLLAARVMLFTFLVDEVKIEYLRNQVYQFMPWVLFSTLVAGALVRRDQREEESRLASAASPSPAGR